jgi:hypothetical protein
MKGFIFGLAAFSLLCTGVHAAADRMDDHIAGGVEAIDALFDGLFARFDLTRPLADVIDANVITRAGRAVALVWELVLDLLLGAQVFAFEQKAFGRGRLRQIIKHMEQEARRARAVSGRSLVVFLRPAFAAAFVLAGAGAVARVVQASVSLSLHSSVLAKVCALFTLGACLIILGVDAVAAAFGRARDERKTDSVWRPRSLRRELVVSAIALPLVYLALFEALSLQAFVR